MVSALVLLKISANSWYLGGTVDKLTKLLVILIALLVRSVEQNVR